MAASLLMLSGRAAANTQNSSKDVFEMSLEELMNVEVYSASKYKQTSSKAPSSVTVITQEEIRRYGFQSLADILNSAVGFYKTYDRNYEFIGVRGFGRAGDYNTRILLLVDGHRLNDNIGDMAMLGREFSIELDLIDRVEIVRGPGSALYGSNALFAVVHIFTKNGSQYNAAEISGRIGSGRLSEGRISYGNVFTKGIDLLVSGTYSDREGEKLRYPEFNGKSPNDDEQIDNLFVKISSGDLTFLLTHNQREKGIPTAPWETVFGHSGTRSWDTYTIAGLNYEHQWDDELSVLGRLSYHTYRYDGDYIYDDGGNYTFKDRWIERWILGEMQITKRLFDVHKIVFGAETQFNLQQAQKSWDSDVYLDDSRNSYSWGVYIQDEFQITENLTLSAGLRRDYYQSVGSSVNPRAALIYEVSDATTLKFLAGKAFRAPSPYELYYEDNASQKSNPGLDPETIKTYEAVVETKLRENIKATVSVFRYQIEDLIDQVVDPGDDMILFENTSEVTANGFEATLETRWDNGLWGRIGYAYVKTRDEETRTGLSNSPEHTVKFNLIYPLLENKLFAGIDAQYTAKRKTLSGDRTDDAIVTNLTLTYDNLLDGLDIQLGLYNLFDVRYAHPGFAEHVQDSIEQDGRTFGLKLTYRF